MEPETRLTFHERQWTIHQTATLLTSQGTLESWDNVIKPVLPNLFDGNPDRDQVEDFVSQHAFPLIDGNAVTFIYVGEAHGVELRHWVYGLPSNLPLQRAGFGLMVSDDWSSQRVRESSTSLASRVTATKLGT